MIRNLFITIFLLFSIIAKGVELDVDVLFTPDDIDLKNSELCILQSKGLFLANGNRVFSLENKSELIEIEVPDTSEISNFMFLKDRFIYKSQNKIYSYIDKVRVEYVFKDENFHFYAGKEDSLFLVKEHRDTSYIYSAKIGNTKMYPIFSTIENIIGVYGSVDNLMIVTDQKILGYSNNQIELIFESHERMNSVIPSKYGILFCTDFGLYSVVSPYSFITIAQGGIKQLLNDNNTIYALTNLGYMLVISEKN